MYKTIEEDEKTRTYIFEPGKKNDEKEKRERKRAQGEGDGSKKGDCKVGGGLVQVPSMRGSRAAGSGSIIRA